jgi:hypothetical protein
MNTKYLINVIALTGSLGLLASNADADRDEKRGRVDCERGDSIQAAIDRKAGSQWSRFWLTLSRYAFFFSRFQPKR